MHARHTKVAVEHAGAAVDSAAGAALARSAPGAARRLAAALDAVLDEGITDFSIRTQGDRRRAAALQTGFAAAELVLAARRARGGRSGAAGDRTRALLRVSRHLLFWAAANGREDGSAATRAAFEALRRAVRAAAGGVLAAASDPTLMTCERCGARGAELDARSETPARTRALCAACASHARRGGRVGPRDD